MSGSLTSVAYIAATILFILSLGGLSNPESSRRGNLYGMIGMAIAVLATILSPRVTAGGIGSIAVALLLGGTVGLYLARTVQMTQMPELVAFMHSLVGLVAVVVGYASYIDPTASAGMSPAEIGIHHTEVYLGVLIGAITLSGSVIAFGGKPLLLPARHWLNLVLLLAVIGFGYMFLGAPSIDRGMTPLVAMTVLALLFGVHMVMAIGGADMPVVVSMLNSYSGWAAAAMGFTLHNTAMIITGALVGSSGAILSYIMCRAMNRSFISVIAGGFGAVTETGGGAAALDRPWKRGSAEDAAFLMKQAEQVIIVPGYGMAVAQAQHALREMTDILKEEGVRVKFAIHPVAGRMPGHMNVLLAEASVPYDEVFELEDINGEFAQTDVAFVIGANDVTNPAAKTDKSSPIYGMPVLDVEKAKTVLFVKRSMGGVGYAGVDNDVFYMDNTMMLLADAKKMVDDIVKAMA
jgi:NAD(P) transhydrogenase subunit beta